MSEIASNFHPIFEGIDMGVGTWAWGDRLFWGYGREFTDADLQETFQTCLSAGLCFFDTAEVYGQGRSEQLLGKFLGQTDAPVFIATKFMPWPWRLSAGRLIHALRKSLSRLGQPSVALYQIHQPIPPVTVETWMGALASALHEGLTRAVGVSNYDIHLTRRAHDRLTSLGVPLASNQIEFNLLNRQAEKKGLLEECKKRGIAVIAYSPLAQGLLTGKYTPDNLPGGMRNRRINARILAQIQPLTQMLRKVGAAHDGKTPAQVAINWAICKGTIPIPGVKSAKQALQNSGAQGWRLTEAEVIRTGYDERPGPQLHIAAFRLSNAYRRILELFHPKFVYLVDHKKNNPMNDKNVSFLPFNALNEFMRPDYRQIVIQSTLQAFPDLPESHQSALNRLTKKHVQIPGFRNSTAAPIPVRLKPVIRAFEKSAEMTAAVLSAWTETKPEIRQQVYDLLKARNWELLPPEADRTKLPGFLTSWPKGEDFSILNEAFTQAYPGASASTDDVSLMVVWLSGRLPYDQEGEAEEPETGG